MFTAVDTLSNQVFAAHSNQSVRPARPIVAGEGSLFMSKSAYAAVFFCIWLHDKS